MYLQCNHWFLVPLAPSGLWSFGVCHHRSHCCQNGGVSMLPGGTSHHQLLRSKFCRIMGTQIRMRWEKSSMLGQWLTYPPILSQCAGQDVSVVLLIARFIKNTFMPINLVPPEVFSLLPDCCGVGEGLIRLIYMCHGWREVFTLCAPLWVSLNCMGLSQTHIYIQPLSTPAPS